MLPLLQRVLDPLVIRDRIRIVGIRRHRVLDEFGRALKIAALEELVSHLQEITGFAALFLPLGVVDLGHGVLDCEDREELS